MDNNLNIIFDKDIQTKLSSEPTHFYPAHNWFRQINITEDYTTFSNYKKNYYYLYAQDWHQLISQDKNFLENIDIEILRLMQYGKIQPLLIFMEPVELFDYARIMSEDFVYDHRQSLYSRIIKKFEEYNILEEDIVIVHSSPKVVTDSDNLKKNNVPFILSLIHI